MIVLYVENDLDDYDLFSYIIHGVDNSIRLINVRDGQEALEFLRNAVILPNIIFLDINMPVMDGVTCLRHIKANRKLKAIPVVIYSTDISPEAAKLCNQLGVLACLQKPVSTEEGIAQISTILKK